MVLFISYRHCIFLTFNSWAYSDECEAILFPLVRLAFSVTKPMEPVVEIIDAALQNGLPDIVSDWYE